MVLTERLPSVAGMRRVPAANLHVTLHFLGSVAEERLAEVRALADFLPSEGLSVRVSGLTGFPKPSRARMLVALLEDPGDRLRGWHGVLAARWPTNETRSFNPHATVARSRRPLELPALPELAGLDLELEPPGAYVSETLPEGARYRPLAAAP